MKILGHLLVLAALLLAGCSSYVARVDPGHDLHGTRHYFVKSNFNDNHGIDARIARALKARGFQVEYGYMTMMPRGAQAVVTFEDQWSWDFKTHLRFLRLGVMAPDSEQPYASATFNGPAALNASLDEVIDRLLDELLNPPKAKKKG